MGWLFTMGMTKKELIKERTETWTYENKTGVTLAKCVRGNCLWKVVEVTDSAAGTVKRYIALDLLGSDPGYGWGYKDMDETVGPAYYNCPKKYLDMVPDPKIGYSTTWRADVLARYALWDSVKVGSVIRLHENYKPNVFTVTSKRPFRGWGGEFDNVFSLEKAMVKEIIE